MKMVIYGLNRNGNKMQKFNEFGTIVETELQEDVTPAKDLHVVIMGLGDEEGTFAELMQKVCKKRGVKNTLIDIEQAYMVSSDVEIGSAKIRNIDGNDNEIDLKVQNTIVFIRAGALKSLTSQALISTLQNIGFFLVNDLETMLLCDNKMSSTLALERNNIPVPRTAIINNVKSIEEAHKKIGGKFPVIIKTLRGTQGIGVSKVNDMSSLISVSQSLWKFKADLLIQEYFELKSDIRTLVVNNRIVGSAERKKKDGKEFRNNVHLGADTLPYDMSEEEKKLVINAARCTGASYVGVDHCKVGNNFYILEVNGSPGIRSHFLGYNLDSGNKTKKINDYEVLDKILLWFSDDHNRRPLMRHEVGYIESIKLDGMEDNLIRAKFDTGNSASATMLHVDEMEVDGDIVKWKKNGVSFESEIIDISEPRRGLKAFDRRPVIEHGITFNNKKYMMEIGLTEKDTASEMLVNRKDMTKFRVSVHPNRLFMVSDYAGRDDNTTND